MLPSNSGSTMLLVAFIFSGILNLGICGTSTKIRTSSEYNEIQYQHSILSSLWTSSSSSVDNSNQKDDPNSDGDDCKNVAKCDDPCDCVKQNLKNDDLACRNDNSILIKSYDEFYWCTMGKLQPLAIVIMIVWLAVLFYILMSIVENFLSPSLARLSKKLKLPPNVAGVTFLSFSNASPNLFSSFNAITTGSVGLGLGAVIGSAVFVTSVVLGLLVITAPFDNIPRRPFFRDMAAFLISCGVIFLMFVDKHIHLWESLILIGLYIAYFCLVAVARIIYQRVQRKRREKLGISFAHSTDSPGIIEESEEEIGVEARSFKRLKTVNMNRNYDSDDEIYPMLDEIAYVYPSRSSKSRLTFNGALLFGIEDKSWIGSFKSLVGKLDAETEWSEKSPFEKLAYIFIALPKLIQNLTIPVVEEGYYSRLFTVLNPSGILLFCLFIFRVFMYPVPIGSIEIPLFTIFLVIGIAFSVAVYFTTEDTDPPKYFGIFIVLSFIMASLWLYASTMEIISILRTFGQICEVSEEVLGVTVVAWGTSLVDLVSDMIVARRGYGCMALFAVFGSSLIKLLLVSGFSLLYLTIRDGTVTLHFSSTISLSFIYLAVAVLSTLLVVPFRQYSIPKVYGWYLLFVYVSFAVLCVLTNVEILNW